jgi:long-subunit acyl-CoA synthetase (AMP-forming)
MKGYSKNEAATLESMTTDGYFRTGDIATMDADGFVFIVDRSKDMLLCGGFNVYQPKTPIGKLSKKDLADEDACKRTA